MDDSKSVSFVAISGIDFPFRSRKYLMNLLNDIVKRHDAKFIIIAGHTLAGKYLEQGLKESVFGIKDPKAKAKIIKEFIEEQAHALSDFLPKIKDVNYHIVVAEKVYDGSLGVEILEKLQNLRGGSSSDIRIVKDLKTGRPDPEPKIPVQLPGFGEVRVLVPQKTPWFQDNVTGLTQRLVNSFAGRTFSPAPPLILAGCTGTGAFLPRYQGVPCVAIPVLHKVDDESSKYSAGGMVGCTVVTVTKDEKQFRVEWKVYDFRSVIFNERELALPADIANGHKKVLDALKPGSASPGVIMFRINEKLKRVKSKPWTLEKVEECIKELQKRKILEYSKEGNRYFISDELIDKINVSLEDLLKNTKEISFVQKSCWHVGALKTLYHTVLENEPILAEDVDAIILNGDAIQGVSHNYEYNGEMLPPFTAADKHELLAAMMQAYICMNVFESRWQKFSKTKTNVMELIDKCLVTFIYNEGNHDEHRFTGNAKRSISLDTFDRTLREKINSQILAFLEKNKKLSEVKIVELTELVNRKIVRVGETRVAKINGVPIGLQHPRQGNTTAKGMRIQQTAKFFVKSLKEIPDETLRNTSIVGVANFHEAAAIFTACFGRSIFGVMTGAQVYQTQFESNINKAVEYGMAKVRIQLNGDGRILSASVSYNVQTPDEIHKEDRKIVFADSLDSLTVMKQGSKLCEMFNILWR